MLTPGFGPQIPNNIPTNSPIANPIANNKVRGETLSKFQKKSKILHKFRNDFKASDIKRGKLDDILLSQWYKNLDPDD